MKTNRSWTTEELLSHIHSLEKDSASSQRELEQISAFVEEVPIGILQFDLETQRIQQSNRALRTLIGYEAYDFSSLTPKDILSPESFNLFSERLKLIISGEIASGVVEYEFRTKAGKPLWALLHGRIIREQGTPRRYIAVVQDITDRKRIEKTRQEGEEKFRTILENMQDCFYQTDLEGNVTWVSPSTARLVGYPMEEIVGRNVARTFYSNAEDREELLRVLREKGKVTAYEVALARKDGGTVWVSTNSQFYTDEEGQIQGVEGVFRDITAKREAEEKLRQAHAQLEQRVAERTKELQAINQNLQEEIEKHRRTEKALGRSESKYRNMLESIEDGYYEVDLSGRLTFFNSTVPRVLGYHPVDLMYMGFKELTDKESADKIFEIFHRVYETGQPAKSEDYRLVKKDGTVIPLDLSASLIRDVNNKPVGFRGVVRDVSHRKAAEQERLDLEHKLQQAQKMEAMGTLAGGVAHDFNNLLMGLQGNVSLMLLELGQDHPMFQRLKGLEVYIKDATGLTRQLLGFARGGKYEVKTTDINHLVTKTVGIFGRTRKEIVIESDLSEIWAVDVDQGQVEQVLLNLYVNAGQAMPEGGTLRIVTRNVFLGHKFVAPHGLKHGKFVKVTVIDSGIGMDEDTLQKVFDPFFTTKDLGRGTGLGLSSAYGIIKNHGGIINAVSEPGKGSSFSIFLPASDKDLLVETAPVEGVEYGSETILLVDDEEIILRTGQEILTVLGYNTLVAHRGKEAVDIFREKYREIDLVILDLIMPDLNGAQVFEKIKEVDPQAKVLLSSGYSMDGQAAEIMAKGCEAFIQKPFNMETLSQKIRSVLSQDDITG